MKKILSIIVPVYNVEQYLNRCFDSILKGDLSDIEIIVVDDGSTDNSRSICDKYAQNYEMIKVFHKENGGLSDARNFGMNQCNGKYLWFIDSDDYIEDNAINQIVDLLKKHNPDVLVCKSKVLTEDGEIFDECNYTIKEGEYSSEEYMIQLRDNPKSVLFCAQFHICSKKFVDQHNFSFYKGIIHEDELWTPQLLVNANKIYYSDLNVYFHYMRNDSIMHASKIEISGKCDLIVAEKLFELYDSIKEKDLSYLRDHNVTTFLQAVWKIPNYLSDYDLKRTLPLKNAYYKKTKLKAILYYVSPKLYLFVHNILSSK